MRNQSFILMSIPKFPRPARIDSEVIYFVRLRANSVGMFNFGTHDASSCDFSESDTVALTELVKVWPNLTTMLCLNLHV